MRYFVVPLSAAKLDDDQWTVGRVVEGESAEAVAASLWNHKGVARDDCFKIYALGDVAMFSVSTLDEYQAIDGEVTYVYRRLVRPLKAWSSVDGPVYAEET